MDVVLDSTLKFKMVLMMFSLFGSGTEIDFIGDPKQDHQDKNLRLLLKFDFAVKVKKSDIKEWAG